MILFGIIFCTELIGHLARIDCKYDDKTSKISRISSGTYDNSIESKSRKDSDSKQEKNIINEKGKEAIIKIVKSINSMSSNKSSKSISEDLLKEAIKFFIKVNSVNKIEK